MPIAMKIPSAVAQDSITVLTGPHGESNENPSPDTEDSDEDEPEEQYEMRFWDEFLWDEMGVCGRNGLIKVRWLGYSYIYKGGGVTERKRGPVISNRIINAIGRDGETYIKINIPGEF